MLTTKPRGTNDFLPGEVEQWQALEAALHALFRTYVYREIRTPIFEHTELFLRSVGETSDIVEKEMYSFEDKGYRHITLRPEGTAGTVRAFLENKLFAGPLPVKLYYMGPMFRYDQPQAGRYRQFHQFGAEVLGSAEAIVDAEIISFALDLFQRLGLKNLSVKLNTVGCDACRPDYHAALKTHFKAYTEDLCPTCLRRLDTNPLRILDCKEERCKEVAADAPSTLDYACEDCSTHFKAVMDYLDRTGALYELDNKLVRGLDYYTQTAFEIVIDSVGSQQNAICGGGRYNKLVAECGGDDIPGMGFAAGMERLILTLAEQGISLTNSQAVDVYVAPLGIAAKTEAFGLMQSLRQHDISCDTDYLSKSLKAQMKQADRLNARFVIMIGDDELNRKEAVIRNMQTGDQQAVALDQIMEQIKKGLEDASI